MARRKKRTVRIMKAVRIEDETGGVVEDEASDFWPLVVDSLADRSPEPYFDWEHNGHDYRGRVKQALEPILYLAKQRNADDAPSQWDGDDAIPLSTPIHEPLFVLPIPGTPAVAVLGTSGAATPVAVGRWLTGYLRSATRGESIELHPVIRHDQAEILERAITATSLELSVDAAEYTPRSDGRIERGLALAAEANDGRGRATISLSMGQGRHVDGSGEFLQAARELFTDPALKRGQVRAIVPNGERGLRGEMLNLVSHRFTYKKVTGDSDTSLSVATAYPALSDSVTDFKKTREYRLLRQRTDVD